MSTRKPKHQPVLYINQPITQFPDISMQERFSTREEPSGIQRKASNMLADIDDTDHLSENDHSYSQNKHFVHHSEEESSGDDGRESHSNPFDTKRRTEYSFQRVKHFREMTVSEKITYLENYPIQLTPITCLYFTETTTYTGILLSNLDDSIEIQLPNHRKAVIDKADLKEIRMLGFH